MPDFMKVLLCLFLLCSGAGPAAADTVESLQKAFRLGPGREVQQPQVELEVIDPNEVEVSSDSARGFIYKPRNAWRLWIERTLYIGLLNVALIAILFFLPKKDEQSLIIAYFMSGVTLIMNFWLFLCGLLFIKLGKPFWIYAIPASAVMFAATYKALMQIKKSDISMADVKSVFARASEGVSDPALSSVDGSPGNWPDNDFFK